MFIIEDVVTTGGSTIKAIERARAERLTVERIIVLIDRQEGGIAAIQELVPDVVSLITRDELLDNVMLYWLPATGASSARLYWESFGTPSLDPVTVPTGCSIFPKEIFQRSGNLHWN